MCKFLSGWVLRTGDVLCEPMLDSHEDLAKWFSIKRDYGHNAIRWEFSPTEKDGVRQFFDFDSYSFRIDENETPSWFDEERREATINAAKKVLRSMVVSDDSRLVLIGKAIFAGDGAKIERAIGCRLLAATAKADLSGANLSRAYLSGAFLSGADLSGANLSRADLSGADLSGAYLSGANLSRAFLSGANLSRAYLSGAFLSGANLSGANLSGADLGDWERGPDGFAKKKEGA